MTQQRTSGQDKFIVIRIREANLQSLLAGVVLGTEATSGEPITLQLVPHSIDGSYELQAVTSSLCAQAIPEAVVLETVDPEPVHDHSNRRCPLNDPETFMHPATRGLGCSCARQ